jgi:hypothetical protein
MNGDGGRRLLVPLSVRILDADERPGAVSIGWHPGGTHQLTIAPDAEDAVLGGALRKIITRELAHRDLTGGEDA